jgi:hypothetical protein
MHNNPDGTMLFDLSKDMSETHDLASARPDDVKRLKAKYDEWNAKNIAPLWHDSRERKRAARATDARRRATHILRHMAWRRVSAVAWW